MNINNWRSLMIYGCITLSSGPIYADTLQAIAITNQPLIAFLKSILFALPIAAFLLIIWSHWKHLRFKQLLQTTLHGSLFVMLINVIILNYFTESFSTWLAILCLSHTLLVGINQIRLKQHSNKVKSTLTGYL